MIQCKSTLYSQNSLHNAQSSTHSSNTIYQMPGNAHQKYEIADCLFREDASYDPLWG